MSSLIINGINDFWASIFETVGLPKDHWQNKCSLPSDISHNLFFKGTDAALVYPIFRHILVLKDVFAHAKIHEYLNISNQCYNDEKLLMIIRVDIFDTLRTRKDGLLETILAAHKNSCHLLVHTLVNDPNAIHDYFMPVWDIINKFDVI